MSDINNRLIDSIDKLSENVSLLSAGDRHPSGFEALVIALVGGSKNDGGFPRGSVCDALESIAESIMTLATAVDSFNSK